MCRLAVTLFVLVTLNRWLVAAGSVYICMSGHHRGWRPRVASSFVAVALGRVSVGGRAASLVASLNVSYRFGFYSRGRVFLLPETTTTSASARSRARSPFCPPIYELPCSLYIFVIFIVAVCRIFIVARRPPLCVSVFLICSSLAVLVPVSSRSLVRGAGCARRFFGGSFVVVRHT
jgi:hypothetical protein